MSQPKGKHPGGRPVLIEYQKAYIAGIIDGEGCILLRNYIDTHYGHKAYESSISVEMAGNKVPQYLHKITEVGSLKNRKRKDRNYVMWMWKVSGVDAEWVLKEIKEYLVQKKKEAAIFLEFRKTILKQCGRKKIPKDLVCLRDKLIAELKNSRYA